MNVFLIIHIHNNNTQDELQFHQTQVMCTGLKYIQGDSRRRINIFGGDTFGHCEKKLMWIFLMFTEIQQLSESTNAKPLWMLINRLTPNDPYMGRTAPLTSKRCILYIYSITVGTEYFKHALYSPCFSLQNTVCFIMLTCLVPVLFTFYIQNVLKLKKIIPAPKG